VTYDHTDADVPMMRPDKREAEWRRVLQYVNEVQAINDYRPFHVDAAIEHLRRDEPVTGSIGYDDEGQPFARTYPPQGMRCS
jgi:hypothetical protein